MDKKEKRRDLQDGDKTLLLVDLGEMLPPTVPIPIGSVARRVRGIGFGDGGGFAGGAFEARIDVGIEALEGGSDDVAEGGVPAPVGIGGRGGRGGGGGGGAVAAADGGIGDGKPRRREQRLRRGGGAPERGGREEGVRECELVRSRGGEGSHRWKWRLLF